MTSLKTLFRVRLFWEKAEASIRKRYSACMPFGFQPGAFSVSGAGLFAISILFTENQLRATSGTAGGGTYNWAGTARFAAAVPAFVFVEKRYSIYNQTNG